MVNTVRFSVSSARGLPIMDRATGLADAYVKIVMGKLEMSTPVCRKTLAPRWDYDESFIGVQDESLQSGALIFY